MPRIVSIRLVGAALGLVILGLGAAHIAGELVIAGSGYDASNFFLRHFKMNTEGQFQTWFSVFMLVWCAVLLADVGSRHVRDRRWFGTAWLGLAAIFAFLAIDEGLAIHENLTVPVHELLGQYPIPYYAWVVPYLLGVAAVGLVYLRFLRFLEPRIRWLFVVAGVTYVAGGIGMEIVGSYLYVADDYKLTPIYMVSVTMEELLEMTGVAIFLVTLLSMGAHRSAQMRPVRLAAAGAVAR